MNFIALSSLIIVLCQIFAPHNLITQSGISAKLIKEDAIQNDISYPQFTGGEEAFYTFLAQNIRYPYILAEIEMEGNVELQFTINENGVAQDIDILRGFDPLADDEVIRVLKNMPKWEPANEIVKLKLSVNFSLTDTLRAKAKEMKAQNAAPESYIQLYEKQEKNNTQEEDIVNPHIETKISDPSMNRTPEFPGGQDALNKYLKDNLKYPKRAMERRLEGRVVLSLKISEDGEITQVFLYKSLHRDCDEEAFYLVKKMPKWIPGLKNGKPTAMEVLLPIPFDLPK